MYHFWGVLKKNQIKKWKKEKSRKPSICCLPLKRDWIVQLPLIGTAYQQSPSAFRQSQLHGQMAQFSEIF